MVKMLRSTIFLAALLAVVSARQCQDVIVPISITARTAVFNITAPATRLDTTNFVLDLTRNGHNLTAESFTGFTNKQGDYQIAGTYCTPDSGSTPTVQILTHGIGFDRSYWNFPLNNYNYSYVQYAVDHHGYSTFAYDRLGIGKSSHGESVNEIQIALEIAALKAITEKLQNGQVTGQTCGHGKIVHVGHSFGSSISYTLTQMFPDASDGLVLTGFANNATFIPFFGLGANFVPTSMVPALAPLYPVGYFAAGDISAAQTNFFAPGMFDNAVLEAAFATGQPVSVGELLTVGGGSALPNNFTGPVLVITGERDLPFCGGDCYATGNSSIPSIISTSKMFFPQSMAYMDFVVPGAGHGLNLEYSHPITYGTILDFLDQNVGK